MGSGENFCGVGADELICAFCNGDGALGVFAKSEAWDSERRGFFLDAAGVGEDKCGFAKETEKIEIADWRAQL